MLLDAKMLGSIGVVLAWTVKSCFCILGGSSFFLLKKSRLLCIKYFVPFLRNMFLSFSF